MSEEIKAQVIFDETSHLGAFRLHMWHRYHIWMILRTLLSVGLIFAGIILIMSQGPHPMAIIMLMIGTFALLRPMIWKIMHARTLRKLPGYGQKVIYTFTESHIEIHGEDRHAQVKWTSLFQSVCKKQGFLFYHGKKSYTWIPRDAFDSAEDFEQVKEWM